jgi:segregation and condensation protein B
MNELKSKIESLLFLSGRPMSERELAELTKGEIKDIAEAGRILMAESLEKKSGLQIIKNGTSFQMVTAPENAELVQQFVKDETTGELSRPSLETLTIIAYRGPVAKTDLDRIRGINCSLILRNLLIRGLIDSREDKKKDESYYTVTFDFLRFLGLNNVNELPDFQKLSQDDTIERILEDNPLAEKINNNQQTLDLPEEIAAAEAEVEKETDDSDDQDADDDDDDEDEDEDEDDWLLSQFPVMVTQWLLPSLLLARTVKTRPKTKTRKWMRIKPTTMMNLKMTRMKKKTKMKAPPLKLRRTKKMSRMISN